MDDKTKVVGKLLGNVKTRILFEVCVYADLSKEVYERLRKEIERTGGTSLDIALSDLSYLDNETDEYVYLENDELYEVDYTKVIGFEVVEDG